MKYEETGSIFRFKIRNVEYEVMPFNGEIDEFLCRGRLMTDVSWSHGITHLKTVDGVYVGFAGIDLFEQDAEFIDGVV
jgi:hypothetical protein